MTDTLISGNTSSTGEGQAAEATGGAQAPADGQKLPTADAKAPAESTQKADPAKAPATAEKAAPDKGTEGDKGDDKADAKPTVLGAPEKYEFKAPEGAQLDDAFIGEFSTVAKELDLSQSAAQTLVDKLAPKIAERSAAALEAAIEKTSQEWVNASKSDKEFGGDKFEANLGIAKKGLEAYGTPELTKLLATSRLGNNPEVVRLFLKLGKTVSEDNIVPGGAKPNGPQRGAAEILYGNQTH